MMGIICVVTIRNNDAAGPSLEEWPSPLNSQLRWVMDKIRLVAALLELAHQVVNSSE